MDRTFSTILAILLITFSLAFAQETEVTNSVGNINSVGDLLNPANQRYCTTCAEQNITKNNLCTLKDLTNDCKMYSPDKDFIKYGNAWVAPSLLKAQKDQETKKNADMAALQAKIHDALKKEQEAMKKETENTKQKDDKSKSNTESSTIISPMPSYGLFGGLGTYEIIGNPTDDEIKQTADTFEMLKLSLIRIVTKGKPEHLQSNAEKQMAIRVKTIKIEPALDSANMGYGANNSICMSPNAYYLGSTHTVKLCPAMYKLSQRDLVSVLTHEIGHSIDPCTSTFPLLKVNPSVSNKLDGEDFKAFKKVAPFMSEYLLNQSDEDQASINRLIKIGAISVASPAVSYTLSTNPFYNVMQCLQSPPNNFKGNTQYDKNKLIESYLSAYESSGILNKTQVALKKAQLNNYFTKHTECMVGPKGKSNAQETFSDFIASELVADLAINSGAKTNKDPHNFTKSFLGAPLNLACKEYYDNKSLTLNSIEAENMKYLSYLMGKLDPHPSEADRVNKVYLSNPKIRSLLKCQKTGDQTYCGGK